jgi:hypothetical protein
MHSQLEQYLKTVEQNLHALPAEERDNELNEIRSHIESLVEAHRELGCSETEAVSQTLAQFGHAQKLGKDLTQAHQSGGKPQLPLLAGAVTFNYIGGMLAGMATSSLFRLPLTFSLFLIALWYLRGMVTTFGVGWLTGALVPRQAVKGTLGAHLLGIGVSLLTRLLLPTKYIDPVPIMATFMLMLPASAISTAIAMFGAKWGAHWRYTHTVTMRLVR